MTFARFIIAGAVFLFAAMPGPVSAHPTADQGAALRPAPQDKGSAGPSEPAIRACEDRDAGEDCVFLSPRRDTVTGICRPTPMPDILACVPTGGR